MTDYPERLKERACELADDWSTKVQSTMAWAAILLIAAEAPIEERTELIELAKDVSKLRPWPTPPLEQSGVKPGALKFLEERNIKVGGSEMSESDRMTRISEIETRFRELCNRNSIAPDRPVPKEMQENVQRVLSEIRRVSSPIELIINRLQETMEQTLESAMSANAADMASGIEEWKRLAKKCKLLMEANHKIGFLGPDAVDMREFE